MNCKTVFVSFTTDFLGPSHISQAYFTGRWAGWEEPLELRGSWKRPILGREDAYLAKIEHFLVFSGEITPEGVLAT